MFHANLRRKCICYFWTKQSIDVNYIQLNDRAVEFNCILTDFLLLELSISDRKVLRSPVVIMIYCFLQCQFLPHVFDTLLLGMCTLRIVLSS